MKIACIIPTREDRPGFLDNCLRMLSVQTIKPNHIELVNHVPENAGCDITKRYRTGYNNLRDKGFDVIFLIEDDDWYSPVYIETKLMEWVLSGKPDIFGETRTIYYHIKLRGYFIMHHNTRSSAMNTLIKPDLCFNWCSDDQPYTDIHLWSKLTGKLWKPYLDVCMGIKHGIGLYGGNNHTTELSRYEANPDKDFAYLKSKLDPESFKFYSEYFAE